MNTPNGTQRAQCAISPNEPSGAPRTIPERTQRRGHAISPNEPSGCAPSPRTNPAARRHSPNEPARVARTACLSGGAAARGTGQVAAAQSGRGSHRPPVAPRPGQASCPGHRDAPLPERTQRRAARGLPERTQRRRAPFLPERTQHAQVRRLSPNEWSCRLPTPERRNMGQQGASGCPQPVSPRPRPNPARVEDNPWHTTNPTAPNRTQFSSNPRHGGLSPRTNPHARCVPSPIEEAQHRRRISRMTCEQAEEIDRIRNSSRSRTGSWSPS